MAMPHPKGGVLFVNTFGGVKLLPYLCCTNNITMSESTIRNLLFIIYNAGFSHGVNEDGFMPEHGTFEAFTRLLKGESPLEDNVSYDIKGLVDKLMALATK